MDQAFKSPNHTHQRRCHRLHLRWRYTFDYFFPSWLIWDPFSSHYEVSFIWPPSPSLPGAFGWRFHWAKSKYSYEFLYSFVCAESTDRLNFLKECLEEGFPPLRVEVNIPEFFSDDAGKEFVIILILKFHPVKVCSHCWYLNIK